MSETSSSTNSQPKLRHGFIKCEFPASVKTRRGMEQNVDKLLEKFPSCLRKFNIRIERRHPTQVIQEEDCDAMFEVNYEVTSEHFDQKILDVMQRYFAGLANFSQYEKPTLVMHSPDFWKTPLFLDVRAIPLAAIHFGNILGNSFLNHYEVSFWKENQGTENRRKSAMNNLTVDFEFDKSDMICVNFQCEQIEEDRNGSGGFNKYDNKNQKKMKTLTVNYQVTVRAVTIRRIIVDTIAEDRYGSRPKVFFELNAPPLIRKGIVNAEHAKPFFDRWKVIKKEWKNYGWPTEAAISDSPVFALDFNRTVGYLEVYRILTRLRVRTGVSIEFATLPCVEIPIARRSPYHRWTIFNGEHRAATDERAPIFRDFCSNLFPAKFEIVNDRSIDVNLERKFAITYLLECLLSRGAVVKDQLLLVEYSWRTFLNVIYDYYLLDDKLCEAALEDLIHLVDGRKRIGSILQCFDRICQKRQRMQLVNGLTESEIRDGFQRVRKLIFTPTRVIYIAPETIMGNRVLRKYDKDGTSIIRITFRDDNNCQLRAVECGDLLDLCANKYLKEGIRVANLDFAFLGCSNSQMRDNGAYFMVRYNYNQWARHMKQNPTREEMIAFKPKIDEVRNQLGQFSKIENVPKMMARLGQCFTQSQLTGVSLERTDYTKCADFTGGKNKPIVGEEYTFSDGVGMMSAQFAQSVSQAMHFGNSVPSCFQIRFRGMKGIIAIDPYMDLVRKWVAENDLGNLELPNANLKVAFRKSQNKFETKSIPGDQIEMVKYSGPVNVALNKPFINILDQVSEIQSLECHRRVTNRIEELMDDQILSFARQMNDEIYCRNKLKEFPRRVDVDLLRPMWGFTLSSEPFFRSLIKASIKYSITKQLRKEQIQIPSHLGRSMLGVVDETGQLQYGQIFVQYNRNAKEKHHNRGPNMTVPGAIIVKGTVLVTKNPCIVTGDVRIFEAVDIPELHHMVDVVVFPQAGPRPHPDEMAGSDLDGDEYSIIWDQQLLLERNEDPFDFSVEKQTKDFDREKLDDLMREFYVKYLKLDSVGTISNNHLHNSDQYGLTSRVCMDLAKKNSQAVDFTKSGEPPEPLTKKWGKDLKTGEAIPPEATERIPDYHMGNERVPTYVSPRLCGRLFREFQAIDNVIKISEERDEQFEIDIDEGIKIAGYERHMKKAHQELANYNGQLRSIMETYGISTEGEIMSGCMTEMRNRISDRDQDDKMSFYNTNQMIETRLTSLVCRFRERFFEEFGGFRMACEEVPNNRDSGNVLMYRCVEASDSMLQKAVAWYRACYEFAQSTRETRKLSFAWLAFDVLAKVKEHNILHDTGSLHMGGATNPMYTFLERHRKQYLIDNAEEYDIFCTLEDFMEDERSRKAMKLVARYMSKYPGLDTVLFVLMRWGEAMQLFEEQAFEKYHIFLMFILFATRQLSLADLLTETLLSRISDDDDLTEKVPLSEQQRSHMMVKFLELMACRKFRKLRSISFRSLGFSSVLMRGEWHPYHTAAVKTYYNILFNLRFEELPISTDPTITAESMIRESVPYTIELPEKTRMREVIEKLSLHSGAEEVVMRMQSNLKQKEEDEDANKNIRYIISARGNLESLQRLKQLTAVTIPLKTHMPGPDVAKQMAELCLGRIMRGF